MTQVIINKNEISYDGIVDERPYIVHSAGDGRGYKMRVMGNVCYGHESAVAHFETRERAVEIAESFGHEVVGHTITRGEFGGHVETVNI